MARDVGHREVASDVRGLQLGEGVRISRKVHSRVALILATAFGGGTLLSDCQGLVKDSVVGRSRQTLVGPDAAAMIAGALLGTDDLSASADD